MQHQQNELEAIPLDHLNEMQPGERIRLIQKHLELFERIWAQQGAKEAIKFFKNDTAMRGYLTPERYNQVLQEMLKAER